VITEQCENNVDCQADAYLETGIREWPLTTWCRKGTRAFLGFSSFFGDMFVVFWEVWREEGDEEQDVTKWKEQRPSWRWCAKNFGCDPNARSRFRIWRVLSFSDGWITMSGCLVFFLACDVTHSNHLCIVLFIATFEWISFVCRLKKWISTVPFYIAACSCASIHGPMLAGIRSSNHLGWKQSLTKLGSAIMASTCSVCILLVAISPITRTIPFL